MILTKRVITSENIELTWAIDYLSRYVLTTQLLPLLDRAAQARVVFIAASGSPDTIHIRLMMSGIHRSLMDSLGEMQPSMLYGSPNF